MPNVAILNTTSNVSGKTAAVCENPHTVSGLWTFSRSPSAPFAVAAGSAVVTNLDADKVDGYEAAALAVLAENETVTGNWTHSGTLALNGVVTMGAHLLFTDATYDIGASGATRPRDLFLSRNAVIGGTLGVTGVTTLSAALNGKSFTLDAIGTVIEMNGGGAPVEILASGNNLVLASNTDVIIHVDKNNNGSNAFSVRNGVPSDVFHVDENGATTVCKATATPAGGSATSFLAFGTTAGFGIYYGSGAPTVSAPQGSLYIRSDGSSTSTRLYVNTDGGTTWTNVTTGA